MLSPNKIKRTKSSDPDKGVKSLKVETVKVETVNVKFNIKGDGNLFIVGDCDSLGNWDSEKGKAGNVEVLIPLNHEIKFKVINKVNEKDVRFEGKMEDYRTLKIVSKYSTKDSLTIDLSFNVLENFIDVEAPPLRPKNGYQLYCGESLEKDPVKRFLRWMSLKEEEQDPYMEMGDLLYKEYKMYKESQKFKHVNDPLPPELYPLVLETDTIAHFLQRHPSWSSEKAYICLRDNPNFRLPNEKPIDALIRITNYRYQKTGSCFVQASALEYKYIMSFIENDIHMLNLHEALKALGKSKASDLEGGQTRIFLESLFSSDTKIKETESENIWTDLHKYGTLVCAKLQLDVAFKDKELSEHHQFTRREDWGPTHTVVVHGMRIGEDGKSYLLVQNTWKGKQFVELSMDYISMSKCIFYHVEKPKKRGLFTEIVDGNCSEMDLLDENFLFDE